MIQLDLSIVIYRSLGTVFDFISRSANDFEWQYGTLASSQVPAGNAQVGTSFRSVGHLMGRRMIATFEITEYEANHRYGFKSLSGPLKTHTLYTLETTDGKTTIRITTQASPTDGCEVHEGVLAKHMQKELKDNLTMLKTILEGAGRTGRGGRSEGQGFGRSSL